MFDIILFCTDGVMLGLLLADAWTVVEWLEI